jgi:uncharacterized Zn finger protein
VPVAVRRRQAAADAAKLTKSKKKGAALAPVRLEGRRIARTFWGKSWCDNLERYSDYENRLPRGRAYLRLGAVLDLQIAAGDVRARVSGSRLYQVQVTVAALSAARWRALCEACEGGIDSLVSLLQGRFPAPLMERMCQRETGLFPAPREIRFECSCPDWAQLCKHVAAVLYGIGTRLDAAPELLFTLRQVDPADLIARALPRAAQPPASSRRLASDSLSAIFGIEIADTPPAAPAPLAKKERVRASENAPRGKRGARVRR